MATYDPVSTATALAENYVFSRQLQVNNNTQQAQSKVSGLSSLQSALSAFTTSLNTVSGKGSMLAQTVSVSQTSAASASASSTAAPGSYSFSVSQLATAQQTLYTLDQLGINLDSSGGGEPTEQQPYGKAIVVATVDGLGYIQIDLDAIPPANETGKISVTEIARAINEASKGKITASVVTQDGEQKLLLNSTNTGVDNAFSLRVADTEKVTNDQGKTTVELAEPSTWTSVAGKDLTIASNAIFQLGGKPDVENSGVPIEQASNTYTGIEGLTLQFKEVTSKPLTVTVAKDESATKNNMQSFVSAYNTLVTAMDKLTSAGNAESGVSAGALNGDAGVRGLRNQLNALLRTSIDGVSLTDYGISATKTGTIVLDEKRFAKKVASNPESLDKLLGATNALEYKRSGVMGNLQTYINSWTSSSTGFLKSRQDGLQKQLTQYTKDQASIEQLYSQAYTRYLAQFTALANLESSMSSTSSMLTAMFAPASSSNK